METKDPFKETIFAYLENRAQTDELFATAFSKENKNIDECIQFIYSEVQKSGRKGFTDEEVFSMAVHYYDEDEVKATGNLHPRVVVNHVIELTDADKKELEEKAREEYKDEMKKKLEQQYSKPVVKKEKKEPAVTNSLFGDEDETENETSI